MTRYLLGIDQGSTVLKLVLLAPDGQELFCLRSSSEVRCPAPGWAERDMEAAWQSCAAAIRQALVGAGIGAEQIAAVGVTGHGNGLYLLDRSGTPLRPAILSIDTRAQAELARWQALGLDRRAWPRLLQRLWPAQTATLLRWLKRHEPDSYHAIGSVLLCKDYLKYRLTGSLCSDYSDMSATGLLDTLTLTYATDLLELFEIPEVLAALPAPMPASARIGAVTAEAAAISGLAPGTPVVGGMLDASACALGAGVLSPGVGCIILGTWSINQVVAEQPMRAPGIFLNSPFLQDRWLVLEASATSAANLEWFIREFCSEEQAEASRRGLSVYQVCDERVAALPPGGPPIIFHPFLFGSAPQPSARAGFYGLAGWQTRAHLLRAVYEGIAYSHRFHIEKLLAAGARIERLRLAGGGARSQVWAQIFADVLQQALEVPAGSELGARGAAMCAGIGAGIYAGYDQAAASTVKIARLHAPNPAVAPYYHNAYREYLATQERMGELWRRLAALD